MHILKSARSTPTAWRYAAGATILSEERPQRLVIEREVRHHGLESPVLVLERLEPLGLADVHPAELRPPPVEGHGADAEAPADLVHLRPRIDLLQRPDDLLLLEPLLLHIVLHGE